MDVLSDLLYRARAGEPLVRQLISLPPWSIAFADPPPLTVVATLGGHASIRLDGASPVRLAAGDIALIRDMSAHTIADSPTTTPQSVVRRGGKFRADTGEPVADNPSVGPRTYGASVPGATTMLRGTYHLRGAVGDRLLRVLPPLAVVPAGERTGAALDLLTAETRRDEPGQDAVIGRLLDLVLVMALRAHLQASTGTGWYRALLDPTIGAVLDLLHTSPAEKWTVAGLAAAAGMSRAAFAARFTAQVGEPPLTYLTAWRMTLAADLLDETDDAVGAVARAVGYRDAFAFSVAFKRAHGVSPSARRQNRVNRTPR